VDQIKLEGFNNKFGGGAYNYTYNNFTTTFSSSIVNVVLNPNSDPQGKGCVISYGMGILDHSDIPSSFVAPDNSKASYITIELIQNLFDNYVKKSKVWNDMQVD